MVRSRVWLWTILLSATLWVFTPISARCEMVKVGVLRMEVAQFSPHMSNSIQMALEDVRKQGILGADRTLQFVERYVPSDPKRAKEITQDLISRDRVSLLLATVPEDAPVFEIASLAQAHKIPLLVCLSAADRITEQGWEYVFRLSPPAGEYFDGVRYFLSMVVRPRTFACLYVEELNPLHAAQFDNERKAGMELVLLHPYSEQTTDFRPILKQVKAKNPDALYLISYARDAVLLLRQCRELGVNPKVIVGMVAYSLSDFWKLAGESANYVFAPTTWVPYSPYPGSREYYERYLKRYRTAPEYLGAMCYAAVQVVADASRRARSINPTDLRNALAATDLITILGRARFISYGKKTQQNRLPSYVIQWVDGKARTVWPPKLASHPYIYPIPKGKKPGVESGRSKSR